MKKAYVLHRGGQFERRTGTAHQFAKDVLRVGKWTHPATGQVIDVDHARLDRLAKNTNALLGVDVKIPYPLGHRLDALSNLGYWPGPFARHGDVLLGVCQPTDETATKKMLDGSVDAVSVCIEFGFKDQKENLYDEVITHVCATSYPVITGQKPFVALSTEAGEQLYVPQEHQMLAATGASDVLGVHDELRKTMEKHAEDYLKAKDKHGHDHADTKAAASKLSDAAHRFHRQATVVRDHLHNMSGGPIYYDVTAAQVDDAVTKLALGVGDVATSALLFLAAAGKKHLNPDGTFKGGFDGCVLAMKGQGHSQASAEAICGKIAQNKAK